MQLQVMRTAPLAHLPQGHPCALKVTVMIAVIAMRKTMLASMIVVPMRKTRKNHVLRRRLKNLTSRARGSSGEWLKALHWSFKVLLETSTPVLQKHRICGGPHGLHLGVSRRVTDPFECFSECGGMPVQFVARFAVSRQKRKGWDEELTTLTKTNSERGGCLLACDKNDEMTCGQW